MFVILSEDLWICRMYAMSQVCKAMLYCQSQLSASFTRPYSQSRPLQCHFIWCNTLAPLQLRLKGAVEKPIFVEKGEGIVSKNWQK